ncbi:ABC transporter substrate-binding protein [Arsenicicoccus dermatophilus]|uniref:ABC transporter substrate-binding protein n=1 Tax=Arsenicicoccus dermatophilus TaxID=1076331 RepID=UPI001F4CE79C|nr:ABC transporter substrate-binding protein [Arsenicicoccus dermatophilus]MCH8614370.1 ABC transporter substrate-binding protein [Arsenicicoccus dermatophilus]
MTSTYDRLLARRSRCFGAVALAGISILLTGCGGAVTPTGSSASLQGGRSHVTMCGKAATYPATVRRIVALNPGQADLVARLGAGRAVVGVAQTDGQPVPPSVSSAGGNPRVLSTMGPPAREALLAAQPDLVLSPTTYEFTGEKGYATQEQLKAAGASTYVAAAGCPARRSTAEVTDLLSDIDALGAILHVQPAAAELRRQAEAQLRAAADRARGKPQPTMAQLFVEGDTITAIGAGVEHSIGKAAGGRSVFTPQDPAFASFFAAEVSRETLLAKNPEVIVFGTTGPEHERRTREWLRRNLPDIKAVRASRLVGIPAAQLLPGTWGNLDAVTTINAALYPG